MKKQLAAFLVALVATASAWGQGELAVPATIINIVPFIGPKMPQSPSTATFRNNAYEGLRTGASSVGTPGTADYWNPLSTMTIQLNQMLFTTSFSSWMGVANPTGAYADQSGNQLCMGFLALSLTPFTAPDVGFTITQPGFQPFTGTISTANSAQDTVEINGVTYYRLVGIGTSFALQVGSSTPNPQQAIQSKMDAFWGAEGASVHPWTVEYDLFGTKTSQTVTIVPVPEPSAFAIAGLGLCALILNKRKMRAR